jgi:hypothetical protein
MEAAGIQFHVVGEYEPGQVRTRWVESTREQIPELEMEIERYWEAAQQRPGVRLIDLPMCRLESFQADRELQLSLSLTSYKTFVGTHYAGPGIAERFGRGGLAYAMGMSAVVESADGFFLFGRRNATVAHYANRVHTFAGTLEPEEAGDVFGAISRELDEELHLSIRELPRLVCVGLVEDGSLRQPELGFHAISKLNRDEIAGRLDQAEHSALVSVEAERDAVRRFLVEESPTPVAGAVLLLCARGRFGADWFDEAVRTITLRR